MFVDADGDRFPDYMEPFLRTFVYYADLDGDGEIDAFDYGWW